MEWLPAIAVVLVIYGITLRIYLKSQWGQRVWAAKQSQYHQLPTWQRNLRSFGYVNLRMVLHFLTAGGDVPKRQ